MDQEKQKPGQAPDLNNLQAHPEREIIELARVAEAAYELEHPTTPGQVAAATGEGAPDLAAIRRQVAESQQVSPIGATDAAPVYYDEEFGRNVQVERIDGGEIIVDAETGEELHEYIEGQGEELN